MHNEILIKNVDFEILKYPPFSYSRWAILFGGGIGGAKKFLVKMRTLGVSPCLLFENVFNQ